MYQFTQSCPTLCGYMNGYYTDLAINVLTTKQKLINSTSSTDNTEQKMEVDYL